MVGRIEELGYGCGAVFVRGINGCHVASELTDSCRTIHTSPIHATKILWWRGDLVADLTR